MASELTTFGVSLVQLSTEAFFIKPHDLELAAEGTITLDLACEFLPLDGSVDGGPRNLVAIGELGV